MGQQFGEWILNGEKPLNKGGNGIVWEAENSNGKKVAIKFLQSRHFGTPREIRFRDEIEFLKREGRAGILPLIDFYLPTFSSEKDRPWFVMPLATPFSDLNLSGPTKFVELISLIEIVSQTLAQLHEEAIWHRDLKPENLFKLDGVPVIGDFGLVDFPEKAAITAGAEIVGPLFYVAPEMMHNAKNTPAGPADVYSLAKTLWVMASGQKYPLLGEQRKDTPALRLSTYCPHERAHILDSLIDRSTAFTPAQRPTMKEFSAELAEWRKIGNVSPTADIDLSVLTEECRSVFDLRMSEEENRNKLIKEAGVVSASFGSSLELLYKKFAEVTGLTPERIHINYQNGTGFPEVFQGATVISRHGTEVKVAIKLNSAEIHMRACVMFEVLSDRRIHVVVGYSDNPLFPLTAVANHVWKKEIIAPLGSALLTNEIEVLKNEFIGHLPQAIQSFTFRVKNYQPISFYGSHPMPGT
jgi:serine/threonine protein kinase